MNYCISSRMKSRYAWRFAGAFGAGFYGWRQIGRISLIYIEWFWLSRIVNLREVLECGLRQPQPQQGEVQLLEMSDLAFARGTNMDTQDGCLSPSDQRSSVNSASTFRLKNVPSPKTNSFPSCASMLVSPPAHDSNDPTCKIPFSSALSGVYPR